MSILSNIFCKQDDRIAVIKLLSKVDDPKVQTAVEQAFRTVDDALYSHERPYYRYAAAGGTDPSSPHDFGVARARAWIEKRAALTELWHRLCTYGRG